MIMEHIYLNAHGSVFETIFRYLFALTKSSDFPILTSVRINDEQAGSPSRR